MNVFDTLQHSSEDYWRQNNIEGLLKELTHTLAQRMPADPAMAIVQHLQKKFPQSFKTPSDHNTSAGTLSKTMASNLQSHRIFSPRSEAHNDSSNATDMERRASNQSQVSGIVTIPTPGSAFTDLCKQDTNSTTQAPSINLKNLVFANRFSQQAVKLGKDIRSDRDILEDELIKPTKAKPNTVAATNASADTVSEDLQNAQTHVEPTAKQLIEYKQKIRLENDRRLHREKLAELAKKERLKDHISQSDIQTKSDEAHHEQQKVDGGQTLSQAEAKASSAKAVHKPIAKSKQEQDILNDENIFQPRRQRDRQRIKASTSRPNSPNMRREFVGTLGSTMRQGYEASVPFMQFGVCKVCGSSMNNEGDQSKRSALQVSAAPTARTFDREPSSHSVTSSGANVDDWFESASEVSSSREMTPWKPDDITPQPTKAARMLQNVFQPISDNSPGQLHLSNTPLIIPDDETTTKRSTLPRMSESDIFVRTPEPLIRRPSSSRSNPSPVPKKHQTNTLAPAGHQSPKTTTHLAPSPAVPLIQQRMPGSSARKQSPEDFYEN